MSHVTEIVEEKQISDEMIAVKIQCCGNPKTASVMTIANAHKLSPEEIDKMIDEHHDRVREKHEGLSGGLAHIQRSKQRVKIHPEK